MFCSIHLGGSDQSNDLGHNDLGSNDLAPEVQAMFFVAIICVTIIWEAMIEAATLSAMISVAIILGASVKAVLMIHTMTFSRARNAGPQARQPPGGLLLSFCVWFHFRQTRRTGFGVAHFR